MKDMVEQTEDLAQALAESEKRRRELERFNEFSRELNSASDLGEVLDSIFEYIVEEYAVDGIWLLLVDQENQELYTSRVPRSIIDNFPSDLAEYVADFRVPLGREQDSFDQVFRKKRPVYFPRLPTRLLSDLDRDLATNLNIQSVLLLPLMIRGEVIGIMNFTNHGRPLELSRPQIHSITRFSDQIAGAVFRSSLFERIQKEREAAELLRREIETLNDFSRRINTSTSLDEVLDYIFAYMEDTFGFEAVILALPDEDGDHLRFYRHSNPAYMTPEQDEFLRTYRVPLDESGGAIYHVYERKKPFYQSRISRTYFESDRIFVETMKPNGLVMVPLIIKERSIGLLLCTRRDNPNFSRAFLGTITRFCDQIAGAVYSTSLLGQVQAEQEKSDRLLRNILPERVAREIKTTGAAEPTNYDAVSVLFTDFVGFTSIGESMRPEELVRELDGCFTQFDEIVVRNGLEKLKTIGDAYMCAGGLPVSNQTHAIDACLTALEFQAFMDQMKDLKSSLDLPFWELRIGIHTGPVTAGVVGKMKFAYDIWGDAVNTASRCESAGVSSRINISETTHAIVAPFFQCEDRGIVAVKGKGEMHMYFVNGLRPEFAEDEAGRVPNAAFWDGYAKLKEEHAD